MEICDKGHWVYLIWPFQRLLDYLRWLSIALLIIKFGKNLVNEKKLLYNCGKKLEIDTIVKVYETNLSPKERGAILRVLRRLPSPLSKPKGPRRVLGHSGGLRCARRAGLGKLGFCEVKTGANGWNSTGTRSHGTLNKQPSSKVQLSCAWTPYICNGSILTVTFMAHISCCLHPQRWPYTVPITSNRRGKRVERGPRGWRASRKP